MGDEMIPSITIDELLTYSNINIIDIRNIQSYNNNHINNSINIPFSKLMIDYAKYLDKDKKYFIYCQKGISSTKICKLLISNGYKVVNIIGGYEEWILKKK